MLTKIRNVRIDILRYSHVHTRAHMYADISYMHIHKYMHTYEYTDKYIFPSQLGIHGSTDVTCASCDMYVM